VVGSSLTPRLQPDTLSDPDIHAVYTPLKYVAHPLAGSFSLNLPRSCCNSDAWYHAHLPHARAAANFSLSSAVTLVFHSAEPSPGVFTNFTFGPVKLFSVETLRPSKFGRLYRAALVACAYFSYDGIACAAATARDICHSKYHGVYDIVTGECSVYQRLTSVCLKVHFNPTSQAWELVPGPQQGCTFVAGGWEAATYTAGTLIHVWRGVHGASDASHMWIPVSTSATTSYNIAHGHESVPFEDTTIVLRSEFDPYLVGEQVTETTYEC